ncbi:MAG TPA: chemoreceptor glutamine deamidase CheD [Burkholderiales bacterium]|nr:chemoreceptor glutamine deamidase CheD [Burkholderiales bacterium]
MPESHVGEFAQNEYFDRTLDMRAVKLLPGEYHVSKEDIVEVTVLGSCVSACIRDRLLGIGGMNHFMLPDGGAGGRGRFGVSSRYGVHAMEVLINSLLKLGARRENFEAKVFGGGNVLRSLNVANIGQRNADFVLDFLKTERIRVIAQDLVGIFPRKIYHLVRSGVVRVKMLKVLHNNTIFEREDDYRGNLQVVDQGGEIELFS